MLKPVLIILHQEHSSPGRVGQTLTKLGFPLDIRRPRFGDPLPETMDDHSGAAIFGGPQSANDDDDFVNREIDWIGVPLRDKKPFLGICLGAQMMARHLGSRVYPHPEGHAEVGYYPIRPTRAGPRSLRRVARPRLPVASRGVRSAGRQRIARRGRRVLGAGISPRHRLRAAISSRSHPRHDVPLAGARRPSHVAARRQAARRAHQRPRRARLCLAQLAFSLHRSLDRRQAVRTRRLSPRAKPRHKELAEAPPEP